MNYIKELNAFRKWLLLTEIPTSAIALWYTLMAINNSVGWKVKFNAPNSIVQKLTGLSKQGLANARSELLEHNIIVYEKGRRGKAPVYQMISLVHSVDQSGYPCTHQYDTQSYPQTLTVPKQKKKHKQDSDDGDAKENPFVIYEQNFGSLRPIIRDSMMSWCEELGESVVIAAMTLTVKRGGETFGYIEGILKGWKNNGLKSIDQVKVYEKERQNKNSNTVSFRKRSQKNSKSLFDELRQGGSLI